MGKSGRLEVGWEKVACWSTKAAISLKRAKIEEKLLWRANMNSPSSFERYHPQPPTASSSPRLGFRNPTQNFNRYYLRNGLSYGLQIWPVHSEGPSDQKAIKNFGEYGAWAYPETAQNLKVPPIISGTGIKLYGLQICHVEQ